MESEVLPLRNRKRKVNAAGLRFLLDLLRYTTAKKEDVVVEEAIVAYDDEPAIVVVEIDAAMANVNISYRRQLRASPLQR